MEGYTVRITVISNWERITSPYKLKCGSESVRLAEDVGGAHHCMSTDHSWGSSGLQLPDTQQTKVIIKTSFHSKDHSGSIQVINGELNEPFPIIIFLFNPSPS